MIKVNPNAFAAREFEGGDTHIDKQITAVTTLLRATPNGQWKFFYTLFKRAFPPEQPNLFLADEIERLRLTPPYDKEAAN